MCGVVGGGGGEVEGGDFEGGDGEGGAVGVVEDVEEAGGDGGDEEEEDEEEEGPEEAMAEAASAAPLAAADGCWLRAVGVARGVVDVGFGRRWCGSGGGSVDWLGRGVDSVGHGLAVDL